jgi:hypothetical protein
MSINKISTIAKRQFDTRESKLGTSNATTVLVEEVHRDLSSMQSGKRDVVFGFIS